MKYLASEVDQLPDDFNADNSFQELLNRASNFETVEEPLEMLLSWVEIWSKGQMWRLQMKFEGVILGRLAEMREGYERQAVAAAALKLTLRAAGLN